MYCGPIITNTATIEFDIELKLADVGVAGIAKPAMTFTRYGETAKTTITAALITWTDLTGGDYHVKIADDGSLAGGLICKTLGNVNFYIADSAGVYNKATRRFMVESGNLTSLMTKIGS
jgi:hypothetical protein